MSNRRTIFLLSALIILMIAAHCFFGSERLATVIDKVQFTSAADNVTRLYITNAFGHFELANSDDWRIVEPFSARASQTEVKKTLDALANAMVGDTLSAVEMGRLGRTRSDFGLERPRLTLSIESSGKLASWNFGDFTASSNEVYASQLGGDTIITLPASLLSSLDRSIFTFRDREVLPMDAETLKTLEIIRPASAPIILAHQGGEWKCGDRVISSISANAVIVGFTSANALDFVWPTGNTNESPVASAALLSGYGLDGENSTQCIFKYADGSEYRIILGAPAKDDGVYAMIQNGGAIVTLPAALKRQLNEDSRLFADPRLFPYEAAAVKSFTIVVNDVECTVARKEGGRWQLEAPIVAPADTEITERILKRLLSLTSADQDPSGIEILFNASKDSVKVNLSAAFGEDRPESLRSLELLTIDPSLIRRLVLSIDGKQEIAEYLKDLRTWRSNDERHAVDPSVIATTVAALHPLIAAKVETLHATTEDLPRFGLDQPYLTLAIDQSDESAIRRNILVGAKTDDGLGRFATVGASDAIFVFSTNTVATLERSFVKP